MKEILEGLFDAVESMAILALLSLIFLPLGIWKLVEIVIWVLEHIKISIA